MKRLIYLQISIIVASGWIVLDQFFYQLDINLYLLSYLMIIFCLALFYQSVAYRADKDYVVNDTSEIIILSSIILFNNLLITWMTVILYMVAHFIFGMRVFYQFSFNFANSLISGSLSYLIYHQILSKIVNPSPIYTVFTLLGLYIVHYGLDLAQTLFVVTKTSQRSLSQVFREFFDFDDEIYQILLGTISLVYLDLLPELFYLIFFVLFLLASQQILRRREMKSKQEIEFRLKQIKFQHEVEQIRIEKLEAIQNLASKVAHDINNYLSIIYGNFELLKNDIIQSSYADTIDHIQYGLDNMGSIIKELLTFATHDKLQLQEIDIVEVLRQEVQFLMANRSINYELGIPNDKIMVRLDHKRFSQVLSNIIINAIQVVDDQAGQIVIRCRLEEDVIIEISDNGPGILPEHEEKIFEPYFTTKSNGTGIGLASSHAIIGAHGGSLSFDTNVGEGTTFRIVLPISQN